MFIAITGCIIAISLYQVLAIADTKGQTQRVTLSSLNISNVSKGSFENKLKLRAAVLPQTSVYLDAIAGGRVEEKLVEQGQYVMKGQPLVRLSNVSLQLDVMSREAQVTEQLNFLRNTQMLMTTNRLNLRRDLLEVDLKIAHLTRQIANSQTLVKKGLLATDKLDAYKLDLAYYEQRKVLTEQRQTQEEKIREIQVQQLEESADMLQKNLTFARDNLNNLLVKAPVSGYLSELDVELGESKSRGSRLGQVDMPNSFKLVANIDEYYLNQVRLGMDAIVFMNDTDVHTKISKIDSQVRQAQFQVELALPKDINNIKRGQNLDVDLFLSQPIANSLLIKRGAFINDTGGNWAFVLNEDKTLATRRNIKLGKKNASFYQVIEGLSFDETVIISNYNAFDKADTLQITGQP